MVSFVLELNVPGEYRNCEYGQTTCIEDYGGYDPSLENEYKKK